MAVKKLSDKAAKLDFSALPSIGARAIEPPLDPIPPSEMFAPPKPKTAPGVMMAFAGDARSMLVQENERLKTEAVHLYQIKKEAEEMAKELSQWEGANVTRRILPQQIRRSKWANRHESGLKDRDFEVLKREIENAGGNVQPIKVRRIAGSRYDEEFEIVFGHRRHKACLELGLPVLATIENISDQSLFVEMDRENRSRKNLSAWEQGAMYLKALEEGLFSSQRKLADAVGIDLSALGKALTLARLPADVVKAFQSPTEIQFRWAKPLSDALQKDPDTLLDRAKELATLPHKLSAKAVFERLLRDQDGGGGTVPPPPSLQSIEVDGTQVCTIQVQKGGAMTIDILPGVESKLLKRALDAVVAKYRNL